MKHFLLFCLLIPGFGFLYAQESGWEGHWEGKLSVGVVLRLVFHLSHDEAKGWAATMDSPDQASYGIPCGKITIQSDSISIEVPAVQGNFRGKKTSERTIAGIWEQGRAFPLALSKKDTILGPSRPQTPKPPYPYKEENVEYTGKQTGLTYGATLTIPSGKGPFPSIVLITGSGRQNRDEEIFSHKPFAVLADYLTRLGYLVLRADDRGVGQTGGNFSVSTSEDFANDVEAHLDYLLGRNEANPRLLGLMGHSEGGMIAPMVAARRKDIAFIVLLAGPGVPIMDLMTEQNAAVLKTGGIHPDAVKAYSRFYRSILPVIVKSGNREQALDSFRVHLKAWRDSTAYNIVLATTRVFSDSTARVYSDAFVSQVYSPWFRYFLQYNPQTNLEKLRCKVLALNGEKDIQVLAASNLAGIRAALKKSHAASFDAMELPGLNHLFQTCHTCSVSEYGELEETFSPKALSVIGEWLKKNVH